MSEKQFVLYEHKGDYYILKNPRLHLDFIEMLGDALTSEEIVEELNQLDDKVVELSEENEQLKKEHKIAIDEMISDYKNLEKENEELKEDKKILDSIKKRHNCSNCVKTIENNNYCYCLKHYKEVTEDEICENYRYWK